MLWRINTSNPLKQLEFKRLFTGNVEFTSYELREIDADDPFVVMRHKVSQLAKISGDFCIVDDTTLDVENANIGVNIKWLLPSLEKYIGAKAIFRVLLGYQDKGWVRIFAGNVQGAIVPARGNKDFGFNSMFLPEGAEKTLGEDLPDRFNARAIASQKLQKNTEGQSFPPLFNWTGKFQEA